MGGNRVGANDFRALMRKKTMSRSALSARGFAVYVFVVGAALAIAPNVLLSLFRFAPTSEIWIRLLGVVAFNIGVFTWVCAEYRRFLVASVYTRAGVFVTMTVFAVTRMAPPMLIVFGAMDLLGAVWTYWALHADAREARAGLSSEHADSGWRRCSAP
jgi:hypothetical protein